MRSLLSYFWLANLLYTKVSHTAFLHSKTCKVVFNKKNIKTDVSVDALVGNYVGYVTERIKEAGFTNYEAVPVKDI